MKNLCMFILAGILTATMTACSDNNDYVSETDPQGFVLDFAGERGTVDVPFGDEIAAVKKDGFIYYVGEDGYYEYDPDEKEAVRTSKADLGHNGVKCAFIVYEKTGGVEDTGGRIIYRDFKGDTLYEQVEDTPADFDGSYLIANDNKLYSGNYYFDVKTEETAKIFEHKVSDGGFYFGMSDEYYLRVEADNLDRVVDRLKLSDMSVDTVPLPEQITHISAFEADSNSDMYIAIPGEQPGSFPIYKVTPDGKCEKTGLDTLDYKVYNGDIYYIDSGEKLSIDTKDALSILSSDGKTVLVAENVSDYFIIDERFLIYNTWGENNSKGGKYMYDRNDGSTTKLKTFTVEEE